MADPKTFRVRRIQDDWVSDPITQEQFEGIAGHTTDYEKLPEVKPLVVKDDAPARTTRTAPTTAAAKPRRTARKAAAPATTAKPATDTTASGTAAEPAGTASTEA